MLVYGIIICLSILVSFNFYLWVYPAPLECVVELIKPQKFKIDVSEFFSPKVSAALQVHLLWSIPEKASLLIVSYNAATAFLISPGLDVRQVVVSIKNSNFFRSMLLEHCKLSVFSDDMNIKLGIGQQNSLVIPKFSSTQVYSVLASHCHTRSPNLMHVHE